MGKQARGERSLSLRRISDALLNGITAGAMAVILILMTLQIIMRYIFRNPLQWADEIARMAMVWMTFLGAVIAFREKGHICVDLVTNSLPPRAKRIAIWVTDLLCIGFLCILTVTGFQYVRMNLHIVSLVTGIRKGITYLVIPISSIWMMLYIVVHLAEGRKGDV